MKKTLTLLIGLGRFGGTAVAERLYALGNEVLVIDDDAERVQRMESRVTYAVVADARDEAVLRSLGMRETHRDCAIVAIGTDLAASIVITMNLKELLACRRWSARPRATCRSARAGRRSARDKVLIPEREAGRGAGAGGHIVEHPLHLHRSRPISTAFAEPPDAPGGGGGRQDHPRAEHPGKVRREHLHRCGAKTGKINVAAGRRGSSRCPAGARGSRPSGRTTKPTEAEGMREGAHYQPPAIRCCGHAKKLLTSRSYPASCGEVRRPTGQSRRKKRPGGCRGWQYGHRGR